MLLIALSASLPVVLLAAVWLDLRSTWASVDAAAESFEIPDEFTEVDMVRQGPRFCFAICSSDDIVTRLLTTSLPQSVACA